MSSASTEPRRHSGWPWRLRGTDAWLMLIGFLSASASGVALVFHAAGLLPMYFLVDVFGPLSLVMLLLAGIYAHRIKARVFLGRLVVGAWAGPVATVAYDLLRWPLWASGWFNFNPFRAHPIFGSLITGYPADSTVAVTAGWGYHFWNGFGFAVMYTLIAGPARWYYAVVWALFLEIAWLVALPSVVELRLGPDALVISLVGHGAYGIVLGLLAQRFIRA